MSASKRKGTSFEVAVRDYLDSCDVDCIRLAPAGTNDQGDLLVPAWDAILECKNTKAIDLAGAVDEARFEALNARRRFGIAIIKRRMHNVARAYAVIPLEDLVDLLEKQ